MCGVCIKLTNRKKNVYGRPMTRRLAIVWRLSNKYKYTCVYNELKIFFCIHVYNIYIIFFKHIYVCVLLGRCVFYRTLIGYCTLLLDSYVIMNNNLHKCHLFCASIKYIPLHRKYSSLIYQ